MINRSGEPFQGFGQLGEGVGDVGDASRHVLEVRGRDTCEGRAKKSENAKTRPEKECVTQ